MQVVGSTVLSRQAYEQIRLMIENRDLPPGSKVEKRRLAELLGISQTPINDALSRLGGEGYLEQQSRKGYFVRSYSCRELADLFAARGAVEGMAARLCAESATDGEIERLTQVFRFAVPPGDDTGVAAYERADREFHHLVIEFSRNRLIREMDDRFGYIVRAAQMGLIRAPAETLPEHRRIVDAISRRDPAGAHEAMTSHHLRTRAALNDRCGEPIAE